MSIHYLKIKVVSLAAEARLIRQEEKRVYCNKSARKRTMKILQKNDFTEAQRARIMKRLERVTSDRARAVFFGLRDHRVKDLRPESRSAQIAYGYLRGRSYDAIEKDAKTAPNWKRVREIVAKFGETPLPETWLPLSVRRSGRLQK